MNTTQTIATATAKLDAAGYAITSQPDRSRGSISFARKGNLVVSIAGQGDAVHLAMFIDYGVDGRNWCDSADLKSVAGIVKRTAGFLR